DQQQRLRHGDGRHIPSSGESAHSCGRILCGPADACPADRL
ncbi:MAG: hypothetical protein AVDCRST_MAG29-2415, partial [uncultured Nocardioidaceae bacterium]